MLNIKQSVDQSTLTLVITGRLDSTTASDLERIISDYIYDSIKIDCDGLEYISSAGLRVFLKIKKDTPSARFYHFSENVAEILDVTGFGEILNR